MKCAVLDVDGTIVNEGKASRICFRLASFFQALGRMLQHPDSRLVEKISGYERVVILTSRDAKDLELTSDQLKKVGLKFDEIICAPRKSILTTWKVEAVSKMKSEGGITWVDDVFRDSSLRKSIDIPNVQLVTPEDFGERFRGLKDSVFDGL